MAFGALSVLITTLPAAAMFRVKVENKRAAMFTLASFPIPPSAGWIGSGNQITVCTI